jgi:hypothetical protein
MNCVRRFGVTLALVSLMGCGSGGSGVAVLGKVSFDGQPLTEGSISFIPIEGTNGPTVGSSIKSGSFSIDRGTGPRPGKYRVEINSIEDVKEADLKELKRHNEKYFLNNSPESTGGNAAKPMLRRNIIPERNNAKSELTAAIPDVGPYEVNFNLAK